MLGTLLRRVVGLDTRFFGFRKFRGEFFNSVGDALPMHISQQIVVVGDEIVGVVKDIAVAGNKNKLLFSIIMILPHE